MNATIVKVSAIVFALNLFMNGVDRYNQMRAGNSTARRERRVPMSLFIFSLDASVMEGYALYRSLMDMEDVQRSGCAMTSLREFKVHIREACVAPYVAVQQKQMIISPLDDALDDSARKDRSGNTSTAVSGGEHIARHVLQSLQPEKDRTRCHLCQLRKVKENEQRCRPACTSFNLGNHWDCQASTHDSDLLRTVNRSVFRDLSKIRKKKKGCNFRRRSANCAQTCYRLLVSPRPAALFHLQECRQSHLKLLGQNLVTCECLNANAACRRY